MAVVFVFTKDFVVPLMALEGLTVTDGWSRLWAMMNSEQGSYVGYAVMKVVLTIVSGIIVGIATLILGLIIAVPTIALSAIAVITGKSAGLTWDVYTITLAVVIGTIVLMGFLYLLSLLTVPVIVFFPAYSIHFFAGRYPRLAAALYSPGTPSPMPPVLPSPGVTG